MPQRLKKKKKEKLNHKGKSITHLPDDDVWELDDLAVELSSLVGLVSAGLLLRWTPAALAFKLSIACSNIKLQKTKKQKHKQRL